MWPLKVGEVVSALLLLPLKLSSRWRGPFAVSGFSVGKRLYCGAMGASTRSSGRKKAGNRADLLVVARVVMLPLVLVVLLPLPLVMVLVIFGFRK